MESPVFGGPPPGGAIAGARRRGARGEDTVRCPHNSAESIARGEGAGGPQPFEGLCRFRNELIHEDGMDLLGIRGSVPPRPWRVVPRLDFLFPPPRPISGLCRSASVPPRAGQTEPWGDAARPWDGDRATGNGDRELERAKKGTLRHSPAVRIPIAIVDLNVY